MSLGLSLQLTPFALASLAILHIAPVSGDVLGGLGDSGSGNGNESKKETVDTDEATKTLVLNDVNTVKTNTAETTVATTVPTTATLIATDTADTNTDGKTVTFNKWGFTGSQSVWENTLTTVTGSGSDTVSGSASESETGSDSKSHSTHSINGNKTSNANRLSHSVHSQEKSQWKNFVFIGGLLAFTTVLGAL
ncbi:uncharacterized protein RJT20DRAFT_129284 [Scheffersomyces xylosifermentans]|uniref:uncharacterized protein n=1 Tax=Scheffersomyces xylosifermentans TaxID=1304137 RepID=UPI00315D8200